MKKSTIERITINRSTVVLWVVGAIVFTCAANEMSLPADPGPADYVAYAARNHPGLRAAFDRWQAAVKKASGAGTLPDPEFTYGYFIEEVETRVGPQKQKLGLMQKFPWWGTLAARKDAAAQEAQAARQAFEQTRLELFRRVKTAYYDYWYLARSLEVTQRHLELISNLEQVALTRYKAGAVPNSVVVQAQVEQGRVADRLSSFKARRKPLQAQINAAIGQPVGTALPFPTTLPDLDTAVHDETLLKHLRDRNPELRRLGHLESAAHERVQLAGKEKYPDFALGVDTVRTDPARNPGVAESGKDPWMAMISVRIPLWQGTYRADVQAAKHLQSAVVRQRKDREQMLTADLKMALFQLRDAERKMDFYEKALIPKAKQSLHVARQEFETGKSEFSTLIDAERLLLEFQLAYHRARADRGTYWAKVEALSGGFPNEETITTKGIEQ